MTEAANSRRRDPRVRKAFGATLAVDDVELHDRAGRGACPARRERRRQIDDRQTAFRSHRARPRHVSVFGDEVRLRSPRVAHRHGVQTAFQEMTLTPDLTVLDNMLLPYGPSGWSGMITREAPPSAAVREHFDSLGLDIELWREVGELDLAVQQKIEIARAVFRDRASCCSTSRLRRSPAATSTGSASSSRSSNNRASPSSSSRIACARCGRFAITLTILRNGRHIATAAVERTHRRRRSSK